VMEQLLEIVHQAFPVWLWRRQNTAPHQPPRWRDVPDRA
jgi:hypothetical protein